MIEEKSPPSNRSTGDSAAPPPLGFGIFVAPAASVHSSSSRLSISKVVLGHSLLALPVEGIDAGARDNVGGSASSKRVAAVVAEHVLVTTDGSESANRAIPVALAAVRACDSKRLTLLRVLTPKLGTPVHALEWAMTRAHAEANLELVAGQLPWTDRVTLVVAEGLAADQILHYVESNAVDLVVIASHGSDCSRTWRMGGTTHKVVASGVASMLVVPAEPAPTEQLSSVLVPLDCSARAECVLPLAAKLAQAHDAELVLTHVVPRPDISHHLPPGPRERELIEELTRRNLERAEGYLEGVRERMTSRGIRARVQLLSATNPARALEQLAKTSPCELVLLCAHGSGCSHGERYGSIPRRLLDSLVKPLWIVQDLPAETSNLTADASGTSEVG
jgi:nucleotide-binding universal stress UspA family protein